MSSGIGRREFLSRSGTVAGGTLSLAGCTPAPRPAQQRKRGGDWQAALAELEKRMPEMMAEFKVPGLSMVVIKDAKTVWNKAFGVKDAESKAPVDADTMFEAASMSKPVFAYAVMKLVERGVLDLDAPLTKYTPEKFLKEDARLEQITARHVLSHTSGFQNWRSEREPLKIHFPPGEKWMYSGEGYSYLQSVVTRLTRQPFEPYMSANLFVPFGMTSSGYTWTKAFAERMARPHGTAGNPLDNKKSTAADVARYGSSGALLCTAADYAKFLIEVIDPKPADAFRLNAASLKEMVRPHVKVEAYLYPSSWSLGWQVRHTEDGDVIGHGGDNRGFHSMCGASVERKSGFVVMNNGEDGWQLISRRLADYLVLRVL